MKSIYASVLLQSVALGVARPPGPTPAPADTGNLLDNTNGGKPATAELPGGAVEQPNQTDADGNLLDDTSGGDEPNFVVTDEMRQDAAGIVGEWADSELDSGEGYADRLYALIIGAAGGGDDDLTDDEADYAAAVAELVGDYLEGKGVSADDVDALLSGDMDDNDLAARVHDVLLDKMPQGDEAMLDDTEKFVLGESDDAMLDATYRKVMAIRKGKKVRISKRIAGTVRLTAAQKVAVRKMQRKAFSGTAKMKRARSMRMHRKMIGA